MHIPSPYQPFSKPTLLVVTNSMQAILYLANAQTIEEKGIIDLSSELGQESLDRNAIKLSGGSGQDLFRSNDEEHDAWKDHVTEDHLYPRLDHDLMHRLQNQEFEEIIFSVPEELENTLKESLHIDLLKCTRGFIPKNLIHHDLIDIVAEVQEAVE